MKKLIFLLFVLVSLTATVSAQKGKMGVGGSLSYGTEIESLGLGARFHYGITEQLRLAPNFNYFFGSNNVSSWDLNGDIHYLFPIQDKLTLYPLAGLAFSQWSVDGFEGISGTSDTNIGLNLGGGVQYDFTDKLSFIGETKYVLSDGDQLVLTAGVVYHF